MGVIYRDRLCCLTHSCTCNFSNPTTTSGFRTSTSGLTSEADDLLKRRLRVLMTPADMVEEPACLRLCRGCRTWPLSDPIVAVHQIGISACPRLMVVPIGKDASPISLQFVLSEWKG